jgi:hypothetical protein
MLKNVRNIIFILNGDRKLDVVCESFRNISSIFFFKLNDVHHQIWFMSNVHRHVREHVKIPRRQLHNVIHIIMTVPQVVFVQMEQYMIVFKMNVFNLNNVHVNIIIFTINQDIKFQLIVMIGNLNWFFYY